MSDYAQHAAAQTARQVRQMAAIMGACALLFWPLDPLIVPPATAAAFSVWRVAIAVLSLSGVIFLPRLAHRPRALYLFITGHFMAGTAACGYSFSLTGGLDKPWFHLCYFIPFLYVFVQVSLAVRVIGTVSILAAFVVAFFLGAPEALWVPGAGSSLAFSVFTAAGMIVVGDQYNRLARANFEQRGLLADRATRLEELDAMKNELFANVSHEFRTPLTLVMTHLKALRDVDAARVDAGLRNCARLLILVDELLDLARLRGRADLQRQRADLARLVNDVASAFRSDASPAEELTVSGTSEPLAAWVDPRQIRTAVYNLVSNAFKFSDAATRRVRVELATAGEKVEITVEDNGIGIPAVQLERVFERFVQIEGGAARRQGGVGIGLALVQEIARAHRGQVSVDSEPGRGSRFTISLPSLSPLDDAADEVPAEAAGAAQLEIFKLARSAVPAAPAVAGRGVPARQRVLVVEDDPELRAHLTTVLGSRFMVTAAADGAEALERAGAEPPDLLVTDLMTPRMSGIELLRELRRGDTARLARLPALVITARAAVDARAEAYAAGADDFLSKPFDDAELLARADNLLALRRQEQELGRLNAQLEARVAARTEELRRLAAHLETAREDERRRIAREIHDEAGQLLSALRMELSVARKSAKNGAEGVTDALTRMDGILDDTLRVVRELVADLRPRVLDEMGLAAALHWYVRRFQDLSGVTCDLSVDEIVASPEVATASFRIVQEALTNVARHAGARRVEVALRREGDSLQVSVADDGSGFDLAVRRSAGFGLLGMRERAQALGGALHVSTEPGHGTTCTVRFPLTAR